MYDMPSPYGMNININPANQMFLPRVTVREVEGEQGARNVLGAVFSHRPLFFSK